MAMTEELRKHTHVHQLNALLTELEHEEMEDHGIHIDRLFTFAGLGMFESDEAKKIHVKHVKRRAEVLRVIYDLYDAVRVEDVAFSEGFAESVMKEMANE